MPYYGNLSDVFLIRRPGLWLLGRRPGTQRTISMICACWCWPLSFGWGSVYQVCQPQGPPCPFCHVRLEGRWCVSPHWRRGERDRPFLQGVVYSHYWRVFCMGNLSLHNHLLYLFNHFLYKYSLINIYFIFWIIIQDILFVLLLKVFWQWPSDLFLLVTPLWYPHQYISYFVALEEAPEPACIIPASVWDSFTHSVSLGSQFPFIGEWY